MPCHGTPLPRQALEQQGFQGLEMCQAFQQLWEALGGEAAVPWVPAVVEPTKPPRVSGQVADLPEDIRLPAAGSAAVLIVSRERGFIGFIDWCPRRIEENYFKRSKRPMDMFLTHRKPHMKMRWVHCARVERPSILRLAVKYQLHPLPVEDTIQLEQQSVPIVRKYNDNFFVVIPLLRLTEEAKRSATVGDAALLHWVTRALSKRTFDDLKLEDLIDVEQCRFAAFTAGPPHYDTVRGPGGALDSHVISFMTEWKVSKLHADNYDNEGALSAGVPCWGDHGDRGGNAAPSPNADGSERGSGSGAVSPGVRAASRPLMETPLPMPIPTPGGGLTTSMNLRLPSDRQESGEERDFFAGVVRQIQRDYSMLRSGNSSWVLWRLLDVTVDELSPILSAQLVSSAATLVFQCLVCAHWADFGGGPWWKAVEVGLITREEAQVSKDVELDWLQRKVRPMVKVLKHIIKDKAIDPDVTRYLEDIEDHLNTFLEEVSRIMGVCHSLRDEVNSYRDRQQQKVLYVLTLVTTLIMPTHLLTGIFGMNWQDEAPCDGRVGMEMELVMLRSAMVS
eukprot:Skav232399  [mRNA]  locus=scaffold1077:631446:654792:- [translate_table: standard]